MRLSSLHVCRRFFFSFLSLFLIQFRTVFFGWISWLERKQRIQQNSSAHNIRKLRRNKPYQLFGNHSGDNYGWLNHRLILMEPACYKKSNSQSKCFNHYWSPFRVCSSTQHHQSLLLDDIPRTTQKYWRWKQKNAHTKYYIKIEFKRDANKTHIHRIKWRWMEWKNKIEKIRYDALIQK